MGIAKDYKVFPQGVRYAAKHVMFTRLLRDAEDALKNSCYIFMVSNFPNQIFLLNLTMSVLMEFSNNSRLDLNDILLLI